MTQPQTIEQEEALRKVSGTGFQRKDLLFDMADDLPDEAEDADELIEGIFGRCAMSVLYGDSNCGKTFIAIDAGGAVARGSNWMGRRVESGLVIYLATESPRSVRTRLQAYQKRHGVKLKLFAIVRSPIDLFNGEADTEAVIELVRKLEEVYGSKVELIIGDTLARLSAGANENSGEDMGIVIRHIDRIREACQAHFSLIHHCGKNAAMGMRGWSGLRASVDTEIEVTADPVTGAHAIEVTKQRDLASKGTRIGFRLESIELGRNKWGSPITSCTVVSADAPEKLPQAKRTSEIAGAILELLTTHGRGMKKSDVVEHFNERYAKGPVYRETKKLVEAGKLRETAGIVAIVGQS